MVIKDFSELSVDELNGKYSIREGAWKTQNAKDDLARSSAHICKIQYRPFDFRFTALTPNSNGFLGRPRFNVMKHFIYGDNLGLICNRQAIGETFSYIGVSKFVIAHGTFYLGNRGQDYLLPLYLYSDQDAQQALVEGSERRKPNLNLKIVGEIAARINLTFAPEKEAGCSTFAPIDILDYVYAILHRPSYREQYCELLKTDFPRVPYPRDADTFWQLVNIGSELRQIHLLESSKLQEFITQYPKDGNNLITRKFTTSSPGFELSSPENQSGKVWINDKQYFDCVPLSVWEAFVGGYKPAQKWLKDRVGRVLDYEDIRHYQLIIACIDKTLKLMDLIDGIDIP
jgi:predicted helicase